VLLLAPRIVTLGIGCRRGTTKEQLEQSFTRFCDERGLLPQAVAAAASLDLKQDEAGLLAFCAAHDWPLLTWTAEELACTAGEFTASDFVASRVGVDNVCERAAVLAAGEGGTLLARKDAGNGVTLALAQRPLRLDWRWQNG
jgi:cobalt-precorrin 5A hydrolase